MNEPIIVLKTSGKRESVDSATVHLFADSGEARAFIEKTRTGKQKYWTEAVIVDDGESVDIWQPEDEI